MIVSAGSTPMDRPGSMPRNPHRIKPTTDKTQIIIAVVFLRPFLFRASHHMYAAQKKLMKLAAAPMKYRTRNKAGYLSQSASCRGRWRKSKSPTPDQPGEHTHVGTPVALLQTPTPHDVVSGAVTQASQAEDALVVTFARSPGPLIAQLCKGCPKP